MPSRDSITDASGAPSQRPLEARELVAEYLGVVRASLRELADGLLLVGERHDRNYELWGTSAVLAGWAREDDAMLEGFVERYSVTAIDRPHHVGAMLHARARGGHIGLLSDLTDLMLLAEQVKMAWTLVHQGARELEDRELLEAAGAGRDHAERAGRWIRSQVDHTTREAGAGADHSLAPESSSLRKGIDRRASVRGRLSGPIASGLLVLVTGAIGLLVGRPWLLPSLGPTAVLVGEMPGHPISRPWNTIVGHLCGLVAGFLGVWLANAWAQPVAMVDHVLTPPRVLASVVAIALTVLVGALLRASHPPAAATTLLVSLGSLRTIEDSVSLMSGVVVLAIVAALLRDLRLPRVRPAERMAPRTSRMRRVRRRST